MDEQNRAPQCEGCLSDKVWTVEVEVDCIYLCKTCSDLKELSEDGLRPLFSVKVGSEVETRALIAGVMAAAAEAGSEWAWRQWSVNGDWVVTVWMGGEGDSPLMEHDTVSELYEHACQE